MKRSPSEKPADGLVEAINRLDWNPHLFGAVLMDQPIDIQRRIIDAFVIFLKMYQRNAANPHLRYRTDTQAAEMIESVDLTEFDQPW
jgi:hypothetical protein